MPESQEHIDEYLLAAFLAGDLPQRLREEISAYLVTNDRARDLLAMAGDALYAADSGDGARPSPARKLRPARLDMSELLAARRASRRFAKSDESLWKTIIVVASTVLLLTLAVAWHISLDLRSAQGPTMDQDWIPSLVDTQFQMEWAPVNGATAYRIILYDVETMLPHTVGLTTEPSFDPSVSSSWTSAGDSSGRFDLWIEALNPDANILRRSASIPVTRP